MGRRKKKPRKLLVAPGRTPDVADAVIEAIRRNDTFGPPTRSCRICGWQKPLGEFTAEEWRKLQPTCRGCAGRPVRKATRPLPKPEPTKPPLNPWVTYRVGVAEDDHANWYITKITNQGDDNDGW